MGSLEAHSACARRPARLGAARCSGQGRGKARPGARQGPSFRRGPYRGAERILMSRYLTRGTRRVVPSGGLQWCLARRAEGHRSFTYFLDRNNPPLLMDDGNAYIIALVIRDGPNASCRCCSADVVVSGSEYLTAFY